MLLNRLSGATALTVCLYLKLTDEDPESTSSTSTNWDSFFLRRLGDREGIAAGREGLGLFLGLVLSSLVTREVLGEDSNAK